MICRRCLTRASALTRPLSQRTVPLLRSFSAAPIVRNAAAPAPAPPTTKAASPTFSTPLGDAGTAEAKPALSACSEGTVLTGLNYFKNKTDPVALADDAYPEWLWGCLDVTVKKSDEGENADAEAEFCMSPPFPLGASRLDNRVQRIRRPRILSLLELALLPF